MRWQTRGFYARLRHKENWHRWFAWHPVQVADGEWRWLEYVERKGTRQCATVEEWWEYEYRDITQPEHGESDER